MGKVKIRVSMFTVLLLLILPILTGMAGASTANSFAKVNVIIAFDKQPGPNEQALVRSHGGSLKYTYDLVPAIAASIPETAITGLLKNPRVLRVEPDVNIFAIGELDDTWGVNRIGSGAVHSSGNYGAGVKIAVIDSGIDYSHLDLNDNYAGGYDFYNGDNDPWDDNGHGTHVAGTIAAEKNNGGVVGVAPSARIYALKVLGANGSGSFSNVIAALQWAVDNGIQVTNNSYGSSGDPGQTVKAAFDAAYARGVLHVAAAGNSGKPPGKGDNVEYPARYSSVIAVAATDSSDTRASFSSTGFELELAAPGVGIKSTIPGGGYAVYSGTSMASPHVAGAAALIIASGISGPDNVRAQLQQSSLDLGAAGRDPLYGYGRVNMAADVSPPLNDAPLVSILQPSDSAVFETGTMITLVGSATDAEDGELTDSMTWTSDKDGKLGVGGIIYATLSNGTHTITAQATDSGGITGSASLNLTVASSSNIPSTVSISSISYSTGGGKGGNAHLTTTLSLVNNLGNPVAGASVSVELFLNGTLYSSATSTTGTNGMISFRISNAPSGDYTIKAKSILAAGLTWDGITPYNKFTK